MTRFVRRTIPRSSMTLKLSWIKPRSFSPIFFRRSIETVMPIVINPSPPIWIRHKITACPKSVQCVNVSTTIRPVTQVALVAVNSADKNVVVSPGFVDHGSSNNRVPMSIMIKKPPAINCIPEKRLLTVANMAYTILCFLEFALHNIIGFLLFFVYIFFGSCDRLIIVLPGKAE